MSGHEFSQAWVISLASQSDRLREFYESLPDDWPFPRPDWLRAIDGTAVTCPNWYPGGAGGWGCFLSHQRILQDAVDRQLDSVLVFEDDAIFVDGFSQRATAFLDAIPGQWNWIYLGGQHIERNLALPQRVNDLVYRPYNVHRAHAYALQGKSTIRRVLAHLIDRSAWGAKWQIDHRFGELHKRFLSGEIQGDVYVPDRWLVGQRAGYSNIKCKLMPANFFPDAVDITT